MAAPLPSSGTAPLPLAGFTVGVTAARRADELGAMLERRGARVQHGPAIRIVSAPDDVRLHEATRAVLDAPPDIVVATTAIGFRGWLEAADGWGLGDTLLEVLGRCELAARGPKARGAIRAAELPDPWFPKSESSAGVLSHLLSRGVEGLRIAIQLHGEPLPDVVDTLRLAGAEVVELPVYRWMPPQDLAPLDRLLDAVVGGGVDVLSFTSAPAVASTLSRADGRGVHDKLVEALRGPVTALCVGPVTSARLEGLGIETVQPARSRLGAMVRVLEDGAPGRAVALPVAGHQLEVRGHAALVDGVLQAVPAAPMALLRVLAERPGRVVSRSQLLGALPRRGGGEHAVDMAINRLRQALGAPELVQTVVKRGYRLAFEPEFGQVGARCAEEGRW
ncbi:uroporphyrinogen-III synthase [Pseudonocardia sp. WMMC193]|uniref:uroporphyrinogen-III synthase n=1 Tax=Pseudonocardia sp. WMMC193 TaxID=2911965 RepID=UPI001F03273C|nr:uroporphyrinogen-III synthase [Pseudonocardia sp. WMMC193]MCF7553677.1 uroporphyrinogen-III synthase [Pseudonocardia sp. WMMC193]